MDESKKLEKGKAKQLSRKISCSVFPSDVEENILSRLPVKSLMRFRCVCKNWCNLVTKSHFIKMHFNRSTQIKDGSKLVFADEGKIYSIDVEAYGKQYIETGAEQKDYMDNQCRILPFLVDRGWDCDDPNLRIIGSCNGLLCLYAFSGLCLLNPVTKEYKRLPNLEILEYSFKDYAFGYSPRTDEHKVLVIIEVNGDTDFWVYTLGTNSSWRLIEGTKYKIHPHNHPLVNGAIHWMASVRPSFSILPISFDFGDEKFRLLSLPKSFSQEDTNQSMGLVESGGFLSLCHWTDDGNFEVWIMMDYGDEQSWTKQFSVVEPILSGLGDLFRDFFRPFCILKNDKVVLYEADLGFFILDAVKKEIFFPHVRPQINQYGAEMYLESLVSLRTDGGVDGSSEQERREMEQKQEGFIG
ncbi:hypothetical protein NE237_024297 [Protea cynaroides]|uniref:F-box domain-containing protein n=1 Tax=Protea cynaroides TaxID=273540 RepID=A0A9Q0HGK9_9MAGN|nr:hypothetical protein NE237_024297 [Protea cynaroides]